MNGKEYYIDKSIMNPQPIKHENAVIQESKKAKAFCVEVKNETLGDCDNTPEAIAPIISGVVARLPVVLAELTVNFNVASKIALPEPALEIKNIKKRIKITQCMLLQDTNILFIKGFVRKNIDYSTKNCFNQSGICGDIRHCTVDVPFECTTAVAFNGTPPADPIFNTSNEFEYLATNDLPNSFAEKDKLRSGDLSEYNQISTEFFNDLPFCRIISARIVEFDEHLHRESISYGNYSSKDCYFRSSEYDKYYNDQRQSYPVAPVGEKLFTAIEEKMVISLRLQILQDRVVAIGPTAGIAGRDC